MVTLMIQAANGPIYKNDDEEKLFRNMRLTYNIIAQKQG